MSSKASQDNRPIVSRWGNPILDDEGWVTIPGWILRNYAKCGVSPLEMMFVTHVMSFKYDHQSGKPENAAKPSLATIAVYMGRDIRNVRRIKSSLIDKGLLTVTQPDGKGKADQYDFKGLCDRCFKYAMEQQSSQAASAQTPDKNARGKKQPRIKTPGVPRINLSAEELEGKDQEVPKPNAIALGGASASTPDPFGGLDDLEPKQRELLNKTQAQAATVRLSAPALNDQATQNPTGTDSTTTPPQSSAKVPPAAALPKPPQPHIAIIDAWHWNIPDDFRPIGKPAYAANAKDAMEILQAGVTADQVGRYVKETYASYAEWAKAGNKPIVMSLQHVKKGIKGWLNKDNIVPFKPSQAQQTQEQKAANSQSKTKYFKLPKDAKPWEDL